MYCCDELTSAAERGMLFYGDKSRIDDGRILNEIDTEYFIRSEAGRGFNYFGINYCPFCGRPLSRGLWGAEKKK